MIEKISQGKYFLARPGVLTGIKIAILTASLVAAFFLKTGVVSADPGWGVVGG